MEWDGLGLESRERKDMSELHRWKGGWMDEWMNG